MKQTQDEDVCGSADLGQGAKEGTEDQPMLTGKGLPIRLKFGAPGSPYDQIIQFLSEKGHMVPI